MLNAKAKLTSEDKMKGLLDKLKKIASLEVYVGIPEVTGPREVRTEEIATKGEAVSNAQLCYIHTHGSPVNNIPARPIIEPAIEAEDNKEAIAKQLGEASKALLDQKQTEVRRSLRLAGMEGQNRVRAWFIDPRNGWAQNSPLTALRKVEKLRGKALKEVQGRLAASESIGDISRPLIDTGQLRRSMTYVVKEE